jgi:hypothetical protein
VDVEEVRPSRAVLNGERKPAISTDLVLGTTNGIHWRPIVLQATAVWAATRVAYAVFTYFAVVLNIGPLTSQTHSVPANLLLQSWQRWDTNWYLFIAVQGFHIPQTAAFFPLYPLLVHLAILSIGQQHALVAALIVANVGTLGAFIAVGLLAAGELGNEAAAWRTLRVFIAYPLAFFLTAAYTEGTFIAFAVGTLFAARRGQWGWAALLAFLASLTRPTGAALLLPLLYEYGRQHEWWRREHWQPRQWLPLMRGVARIEAATVIGAVPLAFGIYSSFCWVRFGDPIMWLRAERIYWGHVRTPLWQTLGGAAHLAFGQPGLSDMQARALVNLVPVLAVGLLSLIAIRRTPLMFTLYTCGLLYLALASPDPNGNNWVTSDGRYMLAAAPMFLLLSDWADRRPWLDMLLVTGGMLVQALLAAVFLRNGGVN